MDMNLYVAEKLLEARLAELQTEARRMRLGAAATRPLRVTVGLALMRLGAWAAGPTAPAAAALLTR